MKTIEERAQEYAHQYRRDAHDLKGERADAAFAAYCQGAEDEHKELTRWHDPRWELPEPSTPVLGKQQDNQKTYYKIVYRHEYDNEAGRYMWTDSNGCPIYVDGWREIH